jgi:hypothetical protein
MRFRLHPVTDIRGLADIGLDMARIVCGGVDIGRLRAGLCGIAGNGKLPKAGWGRFGTCPTIQLLNGVSGCLYWNQRSVIALDRATGSQIWETPLVGGEFVNLLVDDDAIIAATRGEMFCVDADSDGIRWRNKLPGMGIGLVTIATANGVAAVSAMRQKRVDDKNSG